MDKMTFASYKFKPSDVIEGLNRYFAESKAFRYRRVPLEIRNGEVKPGNYYVFRNIVFDVTTPKVKELGYYYLICDPEEVVGVAINWLREEHDIFYTPGMEVPVEDFDVDEAFKEYEKATRTSDIFCEGSLDMVPVAKVREALGIAEDSDIFECIEYRNRQLETLRDRLVVKRRMYDNAIDERNKFGRRLRDIREASGMADDDRSDLVEYIETLRKSEETYEDLYKQYEKMYSELRDAKFTKLSAERTHYKRCYESLKNGILEVYREIFDCSNGDPEGTIKETLQDILTEYKRVLKLKDDAESESESDKWRRCIAEILGMHEASYWGNICIRIRMIKDDKANVSHCLKSLEKAVEEAYTEVFPEDARDKYCFVHRQAVTDITEALKRERALKETAEEKTIKYKELARENEEKLAKEKEWTKRLEQKLIEIQDVCER